MPPLLPRATSVDRRRQSPALHRMRLLVWTLTLLGWLTGACVRPPPRAEVGVPKVPLSPPSDSHPAARVVAGDLLDVRVLQEADLTGAYRVGPDGHIQFPFCGSVEAQGHTTGEVAEAIRACLQRGFLRDPQVVVLLRESSAKRVSVFGYVQKPGTFAYTDDMTIIEAITLAGGLAQFAGANATMVIRRADDGTENKFKVPVQDIGTGRAPNFYMRPGDVVYVPESAF